MIGEMGIIIQLVDVIYACSEGWESPELACKGCSGSFARGFVRFHMCVRGDDGAFHTVMRKVFHVHE